ncbi:glutamate synthase subunit beta [Desulfatitalea alkaliphila]|uniref:Glutamate synthase subunit beta n=1 Tax=Desulfatitalea alkaliphila TaxID=2929485 RepID=A0AA41UNI4_9BACT|nr:glutamate synthase subunit beta [Desulfatitalea alkaliphila]MCJ8499543.1 glutamate synthase subunit beta [Desulfatitalea alkaliphila]
MGKPDGFVEFGRALPRRRPVVERLGDYREIYLPFPREQLVRQAARCMDCGVPTCIAGCPLGNLIPEWNDAVYRGQWQQAVERLHATNNFPEFTGRLCPAPCEEACVLGINEPAVTIEQIEKEIIEHAFAQGWIRPRPPERRTGRRVAVVGSGPAGLACAAQLNQAGHQVTVFERHDRIGGLLRYGIPDFKMEKQVLDRRLALLAAEGVRFRTSAAVGVEVSVADLKAFDAVVLCLGATVPRDLSLPGRKLDGIHFAMDFLTQQNRRVAGDAPAPAGQAPIHAADKNVIVIGGGDTGSDCIGTCLRQKARSVVNFEAAERPTAERPGHQPWPYYPTRLRTSSSHEEGGERYWNILTESFQGHEGRVTGLTTVDIRMTPQPDGPPRIKELPGTTRHWPTDLVLIAIGYRGPETNLLAAQLSLPLNQQGTIATNDHYMTAAPGIFTAGDARRGQSLIVWAISEGREAARAVDLYLMGTTRLPSKGCCDLPLVR